MLEAFIPMFQKIFMVNNLFIKEIFLEIVVFWPPEKLKTGVYEEVHLCSPNNTNSTMFISPTRRDFSSMP